MKRCTQFEQVINFKNIEQHRSEIHKFVNSQKQFSSTRFQNKNKTENKTQSFIFQNTNVTNILIKTLIFAKI